MKYSNNRTDEFSEDLKQLPQLEIPTDIFRDVQKQLINDGFILRHKILSSLSLAVVLALTIVFFVQRNSLDEKDLLIQELVKRTMQLEQLLVAETPTYSPPGSQVLEKIVNMENYLAKLDEDIKRTNDKNIKSRLMAAKLDLLGDLVLLQRKINDKPDYQKVKPYVI